MSFLRRRREQKGSQGYLEKKSSPVQLDAWPARHRIEEDTHTHTHTHTHTQNPCTVHTKCARRTRAALRRLSGSRMRDGVGAEFGAKEHAGYSVRTPEFPTRKMMQRLGRLPCRTPRFRTVADHLIYHTVIYHVMAYHSMV